MVKENRDSIYYSHESGEPITLPKNLEILRDILNGDSYIGDSNDFKDFGFYRATHIIIYCKGFELWFDNPYHDLLKSRDIIKKGSPEGVCFVTRQADGRNIRTSTSLPSVSEVLEVERAAKKMIRFSYLLRGAKAVLDIDPYSAAVFSDIEILK